jgi:biopolymer transport protein ExbD
VSKLYDQEAPMAMSLGGRREGPTAEINVTPMADIMIVLLIIFMVATPLITQSGVILPPARNTRNAQSRPIVVIMTLERALSLEGSTARDEAAVSSEVRARLDGVAAGTRLVHLKADTALPYDEVQRVLDLLRALGAEEVALMTSVRPEA